MRKKIYPKVDKDTSIKFRFNNNDKHYTIRFAGNPLFIIEYLYNDLWGTDFMKVYKMVELNDLDSLSQENINALAQAITLARKFLHTLETIGEDGRSPLVIYVDDLIVEDKTAIEN